MTASSGHLAQGRVGANSTMEHGGNRVTGRAGALALLRAHKQTLAHSFGVVDLVTDKALRAELRPYVERDAIHV